MPPSHSRDWWITAAADRLPPLAQAKVWGLHTAAKIKGWKLTDAEIATHVDKVISTKSLTAEAKKGTNAKEAGDQDRQDCAGQDVGDAGW